jgi:hypothetical protein
MIAHLARGLQAHPHFPRREGKLSELKKTDTGDQMKLLAIVALSFTTIALAQGPAVPTSPPQPPAPLKGSIAAHPAWSAAKPEDVRSVDAIVNSLYSVISGPRGQARDWDRMRSLFVPDARLIPSRLDRDTHRADAVILSIDGYIERSGPLMTASGFFERGIHNEVQQFGNIVHIWSTYESRHSAEDPLPFARGINSIQLLKSGDRYYIVQILWDSETPTSPIPSQYLNK